eukprot:1148169-Pelagomonas_calceolata.AAC.10
MSRLHRRVVGLSDIEQQAMYAMHASHACLPLIPPSTHKRKQRLPEMPSIIKWHAVRAMHTPHAFTLGVFITPFPPVFH